MGTTPVARPCTDASLRPTARLPLRRVRWMTWHGWSPLGLLCLLMTLLGWLFVHVFAGEPNGSDNSYHYGELVHLAAAIRAGDWNWWNPSGNSGFVSGYYYQILAQALPALLSAATGLSPLFCFQLAIFMALILVPAAAYRAVRVAGGSSWQALGAAIAVPCAVGSSRWGHGTDGTFTVGLYTQLWALAAFPLAFAHATRWLETRRGLAPALGWSLIVGLCHPFVGVALSVALGAGTLGATLTRGMVSGIHRVRRALRRTTPQVSTPVLAMPGRAHSLADIPAAGAGEWQRLLGLGTLLLLGVSCVWMPILVDYDGFGGLPQRATDEVGPGLLTVARWFVSGHLLDAGRSVCLLTALLPLVWYRARTRWLPRVWAASLAYVLLLSIGPYLPTIGDDLVPPVRFLGPLQIMLAMGVGIGVAALVEQSWQRQRSIGRHLAVRCGSLAAVGLAAGLVVVSGIAIQRGRVTVASDFPKIARETLQGVMDAMAAAPPGRFQVYGSAAIHWTMMLPFVEAGRPATDVPGGAALQSSPTYAYYNALRDGDPARIAWVFDAPVALSRPGALQLGTVLHSTPAYELRVLPSPGLVGPVQVVGELPPDRYAARAAGLRWLASDLPMQNHVLAYHGTGANHLLPQGRTLTATRGYSAIHAVVAAEAPTTFVVRETWHPRWRAWLDGREVPIARVTPASMAIEVPAAQHVLELRFERPLWTWLLWLLGPGVVAVAWAWERQATYRA